jgi:hypothetical protein
VKAGDTFIPAPPYDHLYMVISDPSADADRVVLVNFTTDSPNEERCCIAIASEHRFLTRPSAVRYKDARITSVSMLEELARMGKMTPDEPLSADLLQRVRDGASKSDFLPEGCREVLSDQWLI